MKKILFISFLISINIFAQDPFQAPQETFGAYVTWGTVWADYDNDGYTDLYLSNGLQGYDWEGFLFKNNGNGTFNQISSSDQIVTESYTSGGSSWGDFNNDGYVDLYIANVYPGAGISPSPNSLHINDGDGTFTKATTANYGDIVKTQGSGSGTVTWLDYNNDGLLDAASSNGRVFPASASNNFLYRNNGNPSYNFTEINNVFSSSGVTIRAGITSADFDEDGDIDIFVASGNEFNNNILYINTGSPSYDFSENTLISSSSGVPAQSAAWGDIDNDGDLDLYIVNGGNDSGAPIANVLFRNNSGNLTKVTSGVGPIITDTDFGYAPAFADYDNDGDLDLFVGNDGDYASGYRCRLYDNDGSGVFTSNTNTTITTINEFARSGAWADFDNDGDLDLMVGREGNNRFFENNGNSNNWSQVKLIGNGTTTNSSAIGSLVKINASVNSSNYTQIRDISSQTGSGSHNDLRAHFGLGDATYFQSISVKWHGAGTTTTYTDLPVNKILHYQQGDLNVTANVIKAQNFMYLFGNTGGSIEFTTADADGGTLSMQRTDSDPGGTFSGNSVTNPSGGTITANAVYSDKYWTVSQTDLTGFSSTVYFDGSGLTGSPNLDEVVLLQRANSSSDWIALNTERIGNTLYSSGINSFSEFAIGYEEAPQTVLLETKIFLEGAYDLGAVDPVMRAEITVPVTSPYIEDVRTVDPIPADIVDWILVELRSTDTGSAVVSKSALIHKDGRIVNDDATSGIIELEATPGSYYIVIKHRNHLSVMSADPEPLNSSTTVLYDFTN